MPRIEQDLSEVKGEDMNRDGRWAVKPDGWYRAVYQASTYQPTRKGDGMVLSLEGVFLEPGHEGDKLFDNLTLQHPKAKVVEIARVRLKELAIATGHPTPDYVENSDDLHNRPFMVRLYSQKADDPKYGDINGLQQRIGEYKSVEAWQAGDSDKVAPPAQPPPSSGEQQSLPLQEPERFSEEISF